MQIKNFRGHRSFKKLLDDVPDNPSEYGTTFKSWYETLQESWRLDLTKASKRPVSDQDRMLYNDSNSLPKKANWDSMNVGGIDGFLLVILGAAIWWLSAEKYGKTRDETSDARMAVRDVVEVLEMMVSYNNDSGDEEDVVAKQVPVKRSKKRRGSMGEEKDNGKRKVKKRKLGKENSH